MRETLWQLDELVAAADGELTGTPASAITGFSIDSRTIEPGDVFVALKDQRDGHEFVGHAQARGAALAVVCRDFTLAGGAGALLRVDDPLAALERIAAAARARTKARVVAVTGSVGKTGTKEALRHALGAVGRVHTSEKSYNNHWGVPLTLARMPSNVDYAVIEIGMNHAGEITPLSRLTRPAIALVTTVEPVHLEFFPSVEAIADAKAEIFAGLEPGGVAVLNRDNPHFERLAASAGSRGARIVSFGAARGTAAEADVRLVTAETDALGSKVSASIAGRTIAYRIGAPGRHLVMNSLGVVAVLDLLGIDLARGLAPLSAIEAPEGRGRRHLYETKSGQVLLIDESYNANPASMRAALATLADVPRNVFPRRIAVIGDMRELGAAGAELHVALKEPVLSAGADIVFACGPLMQGLFQSLPEEIRGAWAPASEGIVPQLLAAIRAGDVVMIKGSLGTRMGPLVAALKQSLSPNA
jgi:UDP-N-acetylmuramoyl-tripeptide--D-alanyl-D-alanine ligase